MSGERVTRTLTFIETLIMRRILVLAVAIALSACSMDATSPSGSVEGTYTLRTINGQSLPYTFSTGLTLSSEQLTLHRDGTYDDVSRYADGSTGIDQGYYTNYNGAITFDSNRTSAVYQGSVSGNVLTEIVNGYTQTFQKN